MGAYPGRRARGSSSTSSVKDCSIQLEGRLEILEEAHKVYTALGRLFASRSWSKRIRLKRWSDFREDELALLRRAQALEVVLDEALERVEHRVRQEQWPEDHPVHAKVYSLRHARSQALALANGLLFQLGEPGRSSLAAALAWLQIRVLHPPSRPPPPPPPSPTVEPPPAEPSSCSSHEERAGQSASPGFSWLSTLALLFLPCSFGMCQEPPRKSPHEARFERMKLPSLPEPPQSVFKGIDPQMLERLKEVEAMRRDTPGTEA